MLKIKSAITENTTISISVVISLIGGIFWLTTLYAKAESTEKAVERVEIKQDSYNNHLLEIKEDLGLIKGSLGIKRRNR